MPTPKANQSAIPESMPTPKVSQSVMPESIIKAPRKLNPNEVTSEPRRIKRQLVQGEDPELNPSSPFETECSILGSILDLFN